MSAAKCAHCGKPVVAEFRPFCSKRCADVDLAKWFRGDYVIPGPEGEIGDDPDGAQLPDRDQD